MIDDNKKINELVSVSRRLGERFDLVQAGGGNTSVKTSDGFMYVKSSGLRLSDLKSADSFVKIDNQNLKKDFLETNWAVYEKRQREELANKIVTKNNMTPDRRPSIETLLHSNLDGFVLHSHPVQVTALFSDANAEKKAFEILPNAAFVKYETPGIDLALQMMASKKRFEEKNGITPDVYIFQNHGLVARAHSASDAFILTNEVCDSLAKHSGLYFNHDKVVNEISIAMEKVFHESFVTIYSSNTKVDSVSITQKAFFPDGVVFLGVIPVRFEKISSEHIEQQLDSYMREYGSSPRVFVFGESIYFSGSNLVKARESEEVWRLHQIVSQFKPSSLSEEEIKYLSHWEAEKFRQKV